MCCIFIITPPWAIYYIQHDIRVENRQIVWNVIIDWYITVRKASLCIKSLVVAYRLASHSPFTPELDGPRYCREQQRRQEECSESVDMRACRDDNFCTANCSCWDGEIERVNDIEQFTGDDITEQGNHDTWSHTDQYYIHATKRTVCFKIIPNTSLSLPISEKSCPSCGSNKTGCCSQDTGHSHQWLSHWHLLCSDCSRWSGSTYALPACSQHVLDCMLISSFPTCNLRSPKLIHMKVVECLCTLAWLLLQCWPLHCWHSSWLSCTNFGSHD